MDRANFEQYGPEPFLFFGLDSSEEDYCVLCHLAMIIKSKTTRINGHLIVNLETQVKL